MDLKNLMKDIKFTLIQGDIDKEISNIVNDSRKASTGSLFVCILGFETDGHQYIDKAVAGGASVILVQNDVVVDHKITVLKVEDTRKALAHLANCFYDNPTEKMSLIGITGTNGKTSTVFLIKSILEAYGKKTGIIGTIENRIGDRVIETSHTTPESIELQALFATMVEEKVDTCIMEVSSHALDLCRVEGSQFNVGIFTNLTLDHLDYHKTMDNYRDAKLKLFQMTPIGVVNLDDPVGLYMVENGKCQRYITYGYENDMAELNAVNIKNSIHGTEFMLKIDGITHLFKIQTPGKFSVYNALAAIGASLAVGIPVEIIKDALQHNSTIRGRFQTIKSPNNYYAIIDYAHTPDGLENVLKTVNEFAQGRVITVFGCGGDRDRTKRPLMGIIAGENSNYAIITSDNPRTENPISIIDEVEVGIKKTDCPYERVTDREIAIQRALSMAEAHDIVFIAGKGHEDYQIIGKEKIHFDDAEKVENYFNLSKVFSSNLEDPMKQASVAN